MTAMPQMVAIFNGAGGGAAALVSLLEYLRATSAGGASVGEVIAIVLGLVIGSVSFSGSIIAFGKLQGLIDAKAFKYAGQQLVTGGLAAGVLIFALALVADAAGIVDAPNELALALVGLLSLAFGVALVMPIGGADMPVVISLLNSYAGLAACATGFALKSNILIISGALDGSSGLLLSMMMSKAMNRSFANVVFGAFGTAEGTAAPTTGGAAKPFNEATVEDAAAVLTASQTVIIVPGYGMAVSQAQHAVRDLAAALEKRGTEVKYAIHPVAGRMPGHMNVLLAEANVPYDSLFDLDMINDDFSRTDAVLVVGANDVVNPGAKTDTASPIYGMPVFNVEQARSVIVLKRSMNTGFSGVENELFFLGNTMMVLGDAKKTILALVNDVKGGGGH